MLSSKDTSSKKDDHLALMKILIALLENLFGRANDALPFIVQTCMTELGKPKNPKKVKSMLLQTMCMCLWYNCQMTFGLLE